jgi:hypothetical protein
MIDQVSLSIDDRRKIWLYFLNLRIPFAFAALFVGLVFVEHRAGMALLLFGVGWLGAAVLLGTKRPADQVIDALLSRDVKSLVHKALHSLDSGDSVLRAAPLALLGSAEKGVSVGDPLIRPREGMDGGLRAPVNRAAILVPVEDHLWIYSCRLDSLNGRVSKVAVEEHHLRDVVTVRLEEQDRIQVLTLELTNGRRLSVPASTAWRSEGVAGDGALSNRLDDTLVAIRTLLRDKR